MRRRCLPTKSAYNAIENVQFAGYDNHKFKKISSVFVRNFYSLRLNSRVRSSLAVMWQSQHTNERSRRSKSPPQIYFILEKYMKHAIQTGALIAAAAAAMALSGTSFAATSTVSAGDKVHCAGTNSCKGTSECKSATNECKGQNQCKGQGFVSSKAGECLAKNGKIIDLNK